VTGMRRIKKDFTIIGNDCFRDETLSAEALGVVCYLRSKPHDWRVMPTQLSNRFGCGRDRMQRIIGELVERGYLQKIRARDPVTQVWQPVEFIIPDTTSEPLPENTYVAAEPPTENPPTGNPSTENPSTAFPTLLNTESTKNGKTPRTDSQSPSLPLGFTDDVIVTVTISERELAETFFDKQFWPTFPKRFGSNPKEPAKKKIVAAIIGGEKTQNILAGVERLYAGLQRSGKLGTEFVPMAITWINRKGWRDDPLPEGTGKSQGEKSFYQLAEDLLGKTYDQSPDHDGPPFH
jgi:hypothetical protein